MGEPAQHRDSYDRTLQDHLVCFGVIKNSFSATVRYHDQISSAGYSQGNPQGILRIISPEDILAFTKKEGVSLIDQIKTRWPSTLISSINILKSPITMVIEYTEI